MRCEGSFIWSLIGSRYTPFAIVCFIGSGLLSGHRVDATRRSNNLCGLCLMALSTISEARSVHSSYLTSKLFCPFAMY